MSEPVDNRGTAEPVKKQGMPFIAVVGTGLLIAVAGGAMGLLMQSAGMIRVFKLGILQSPGDPPITVGDGSLHVRSKRGWVTDPVQRTIIEPRGITTNGGSFTDQTRFCDIPRVFSTEKASAFLWTDDDETFNISPVDLTTWSVTITHLRGGVEHSVTIRVVPDASGNNHLQFRAHNGDSFDDIVNPHNDEDNNRRYNPPGRVTKIVVTGSKDDRTWSSASPNHPHYTLGFCYQ